MFLFENKPASRFQDAHLLGNGRLGATVYGGVPCEEILVNDDTLWSGDGRYCPPGDFYDNLIKSRTQLLNGELAEANRTVNDRMAGAWGEAYMPLCSVYALFGTGSDYRNREFHRLLDDHGHDYRRTLDLENALETVSYSAGDITYKREYFVSFREQLVYARFSALNGDLCFSLSADSQLKHSVKAEEDMIVLHGIAPDRAEPHYSPVKPSLSYHEESESDALRFASSVRITETDGRISSDEERIYVNGATYAVAVIAAGTNYTGFGNKRDREHGDIVRLQASRISGAKPWGKALAEHVEDYRKLYSRFGISLGDTDPERESVPTSERLKSNAAGDYDPSLTTLAVQYSRYILISGSRPGTQALNLQGIWNGSVRPPWSSNYTTNINVQMCYWPAEQFNLSECHEPMFDLIKECSESGRRTAKEYYHTEGWVTHHNVDLWRKTTPAGDDARWFFWPMGGLWMCQHLWTHYEYTKDRNFLESTVWPVLYGASQFILGFLCRDGDYLTTAPSTSPETTYWIYGNNTRTEISVTRGSAADLNYIREVLENTLRAQAEFGHDDDEVICGIRKALGKLQPYRFSPDGRLLEWHEDFAETSPQIGCVPYLHGIYPGSLFFDEGMSEVLEGAIKAFRRKIDNGSRLDEWPGAWKLCIAARLKDTELCRKIAAKCTGGMAASLLTERYSQLESVMGYAAGIGEMLLQSFRGYIEFLPVPVWENGSFRGIRARGGFECSAEWKNGKIVTASVRPIAGGICSVKAEGLKGISGAEAPVENNADGTVSFMTEPGREYVLVF